MTLVARRRAAVLVPWLALAAVSVFAIVQLRARRAAPPSEPPTTARTQAPVEAAEPPAPAGPAPAAKAAEEALDAALQDLEAARAQAARLGREGVQASARAESAEARLAAHAARVEALEAELASLRAAALEGPAEPVAPPAPTPAAATDDLAEWVEEAQSPDLSRRQAAVERAAAATPEQVARLEGLRAGGVDPVALARLAAALPAGEATDALVVGLLLDEVSDFGATTRTVQALGAAPLQRPAVLEALLARAAPGVLKVALGLLSGRAAELGDAERRAELAAALAPRLERVEASELHAGARAAGLLRLPGLAPRLAALLTHADGAVRVASAHALSLVPDLDGVRDEAVKALPALLLDGSLSVRTAGALLAEALVGEPLAYDPAAGEAERRAALDAILDRLQ